MTNSKRLRKGLFVVLLDLVEPVGLTAAVANRGGVLSANLGSEFVNLKATLARELLGFTERCVRRKHQQFSACAGVEIFAMGLEVGPESARYDCNQRNAGFAYGFGDGLLTRRDATGNDNSAARGEKDGLIDFFGNFIRRCLTRDLYQHLVRQFEKKGVADDIEGARAVIRSDGDISGDLKEIGGLHYGPTTLGITQNIAGHRLELSLREENRIVKTGKPEGRSIVEKRGRLKRGIGLRAGDLKGANDFAQGRSGLLVKPNYAVKVLGHYGVLASFNTSEEFGKLAPSFGDGVAERRINHSSVRNVAENGATLLNRQSDHIDPWLGVIPTGQAYAGF